MNGKHERRSLRDLDNAICERRQFRDVVDVRGAMKRDDAIFLRSKAKFASDISALDLFSN